MAIATLSSGPTATAGRPGPHWFRPTHRLSKLLVAAVLVVQVYPLFWIVTTSLKTQNSFAGSNAFSLPVHVTFQNYARAF